MPDSLQPQGLQTARPLCPWDFPLEWVAISSLKGSSRPRDQTYIGRHVLHRATRAALCVQLHPSKTCPLKTARVAEGRTQSFHIKTCWVKLLCVHPRFSAFLPNALTLNSDCGKGTCVPRLGTHQFAHRWAWDNSCSSASAS